VKNVRAVRGSWRCRALDRRRRETWCFYPQHRSGVASPRADEASGGGKPDSASLRHDGCRLAGSAFVLSTATGKTEIVDNLVHLWTAAERLLGRPCDPLDADLVLLMERELA